MKKCACIETLFLDIPFEQRFQAAKDAGFDSIEFWEWTNKDLQQLRSLAEAAGIEIYAFSGDQDHSLIDPAHARQYVAHAKQSLQAAQQLGAKVLVLHSNALDEKGHAREFYHDMSDTLKIATMLNNLKELAPFAEAAGVTFVLEALNVVTDHFGYFLQHTQMGAELIRTVNSPSVKLLYDVYHMQLNEGKLTDTLTSYLDCIGHIHIADVPGRHEPGTGEINYPHLIRHLREKGYAYQLGFELFAKDGNEQAIAAIMAL